MITIPETNIPEWRPIPDSLVDESTTFEELFEIETKIEEVKSAWKTQLEDSGFLELLRVGCKNLKFDKRYEFQFDAHLIDKNICIRVEERTVRVIYFRQPNGRPTPVLRLEFPTDSTRLIQNGLSTNGCRIDDDCSVIDEFLPGKWVEQLVEYLKNAIQEANQRIIEGKVKDIANFFDTMEEI